MRGSAADGVLVVVGGQVAVDQRDGDHVLEAVVAVGRVVERAGLADDPDRRLLGRDHDPLDLGRAAPDLRVEPDGAFDGGLGVELGREGDLEQHVLHHVGAVGARAAERSPWNSTS